MTRRTFLSASAALSNALGQQRPSNVLLILTDQQTVGALSCHGNRYVATPAMDSVARRGVSFLKSYCTYPVCSPSRSSIFTGRMPHETGVRLNGEAIRKEIPTLGELFRGAGYRTVYAGKWHVPQPFGEARGFEKLIGGSNLGQKMDEPLAGACTQFLSQGIKEPFLLAASFMNPHDICDWIREHPLNDAESTDSLPPPPLNLAVDVDEPEFMQYHRRAGYDLMSKAVGIASHWDLARIRSYLGAYYRLVEAVDRQIGRVLDALQQSGVADRTLVLITSDHGEGMAEHRWAQKAAFWEPTVTVPFLLAGPGVAARGVNRETLVSGIDIVPTLCDLAGVAAPAGLHGRSLRPAFDGKLAGREYVVSELRYGGAEREGRMLRNVRFKYIVFNGGERPEQLFDLMEDPGEVENLAGRPGARPALLEHRTLLSKWIRETKDDFRLGGA